MQGQNGHRNPKGISWMKLKGLLSLPVFLSLSLLFLFSPPQSNGQDTNHYATTHDEASMGKGMPWLGVVVKEVDEETAASIGLAEGGGVIILNVVKGSPAEVAGLKEGDIILEADGFEIKGYEDLSSWLRKYGIGSRINLLVDKDGTIENVYVSLTEKPEPLFPGLLSECKDCPHDPEFLHMLHEMKEGRSYAIILEKAVRETNLNKDQLKKAKTLLSEYEKKDVRLTGEIKIANIELRDLLSEEPVSLEKTKAKISELGVKRAELLFLKIKTIEEFKKFLNEEQKKVLNDLIPLGGSRGVLSFTNGEDLIQEPY